MRKINGEVVGIFHLARDYVFLFYDPMTINNVTQL